MATAATNNRNRMGYSNAFELTMHVYNRCSPVSILPFYIAQLGIADAAISHCLSVYAVCVAQINCIFWNAKNVIHSVQHRNWDGPRLKPMSASILAYLSTWFVSQFKASRARATCCCCRWFCCCQRFFFFFNLLYSFRLLWFCNSSVVNARALAPFPDNSSRWLNQIMLCVYVPFIDGILFSLCFAILSNMIFGKLLNRVSLSLSILLLHWLNIWFSCLFCIFVSLFFSDCRCLLFGFRNRFSFLLRFCLHCKLYLSSTQSGQTKDEINSNSKQKKKKNIKTEQKMSI